MDVAPRFVIPNPDRWAEERQYLANNASVALAAFRQRRQDMLAAFGAIAKDQWDKGGLHPVLGLVTLDMFLSVMAFHDDNHLDQLARALEGRA